MKCDEKLDMDGAGNVWMCVYKNIVNINIQHKYKTMLIARAQ